MDPNISEKFVLGETNFRGVQKNMTVSLKCNVTQIIYHFPKRPTEPVENLTHHSDYTEGRVLMFETLAVSKP